MHFYFSYKKACHILILPKKNLPTFMFVEKANSRFPMYFNVTSCARNFMPATEFDKPEIVEIR